MAHIVEPAPAQCCVYLDRIDREGGQAVLLARFAAGRLGGGHGIAGEERPAPWFSFMSNPKLPAVSGYRVDRTTL